jgi:hypothetical protein
MTAKSQDVKVFPGDESTKFRLLERTVDTGADPAFIEAPPYILNATGNNANGVDVTKWHSVTVTHTAQDYSQAGWTGCSVTFIPWRYYKPITPQAAATPPAVNIPPQGAWIADNEETIAIDAVTLGITQQKVYSTLNCDRMFFQVTSVLSTAEEEAVIAGAEVMRQSVFGVTPRQDDGYSPTVVGSAGGAGGGGGGTVTIPDPINNNTIQLAGNAIDLQAGNVAAGTQRVTIATDDVNLAAINTNIADIEVDTGNIAGDTANILIDTGTIASNTTDISTDTGNIAGDTANILIDTGTIVTNTGTIVTNTGNIATSTAIMDDWDAVHDSPAGTDGVRLEGYASDSQVAAVSANADDVRLALSKHGEVYEANHTYATQSNRTEEIDPANQWYEFSTLVAVTNGADATNYYYIPMASYTRLDMQLILSGGSGTVTVTVEGSLQADGTAPASLAYVDVTNQAYGSASFTASIVLVDNTQFFCAFNYIRVKVVAATGGANDGDWTIYIKKTWE